MNVKETERRETGCSASKQPEDLFCLSARRLSGSPSSPPSSHPPPFPQSALSADSPWKGVVPRAAAQTRRQNKLIDFVLRQHGDGLGKSPPASLSRLLIGTKQIKLLNNISAIKNVSTFVIRVVESSTESLQ